MPAFDIPKALAQTDRAREVAKAREAAKGDRGAGARQRIKRTWTSADGQFQVVAELVEAKGECFTVKLSDKDREFFSTLE